MRVTLSCLTLLCLGCADGPSVDKHNHVDAGMSHGDGAEDSEDVSPAPLEVEWLGNLPLPDHDLTECEVTNTRANRSGESPHTFRISYDASTRTLVDPTYDTVFDANARAVLVRYRSNPGAPNSTLLGTTTYDEQGQPTSSTYDNDTIRYENEYDEQGRLTSVVTKPSSQPSYRDEYHYEDELNPTLWSHYERSLDGTGTLFRYEREVSSERQLFARMNVEAANGIWVHWYRNQRLESLEQYGNEFFLGGGLSFMSGKPNGRAFWVWDDAGNLQSFVSGGTWGSDLGTGDQYTETYSSGCQELVRHFPATFHLPGPNGLRPEEGARSF